MIAVFLSLSISACSSVSGSKRFNEEIYTYETFEIPAALGQPQMEQEELKNLKIKTPQEINEAIKTYADALMFMKSYAKYSGNNEGYLKDMLQLID